MVNNQSMPRLPGALEAFFGQYRPQEVATLLRTLYFSHLREISHSGFPQNFIHESCLMEELLEVFESIGNGQ